MLGDFKGRDAIKVGFSPLKPSYFFGLLFKFVADNDVGADDGGVDDRGARARSFGRFLKQIPQTWEVYQA